ncbi:glutamyl-tRNA reductase [Alicyclobacillus fodiniaquatilis]|uniref:Glutamyl-tRNA reductase n=1 Tax=Alicyclobacillus fodiniaquatilis TaxID=1661150 RepID=A0ABW4JF72_9BACL
MHIMVVGMNHHTASVELRERVSLSEAALEHVLTQLRQARTVMESVVLSTCNRTEVYALVSSVRAGSDYLLTLLAQISDIEKRTLQASTYVLQGEQAVSHAMRVASGLDSVVIGETQILGQMRTAFQVAFEAGNTGAMFNRLFREVIHTGKRAQTETGVGQSPVSVSYAAVQLAGKILGDMSTRTALVVGAGHMGALAVQHLVAQGTQHVLVANRTVERAVDITKGKNAAAISLEEIPSHLADVDVIVSATGAPGFTISAATMKKALKKHRKGPVVMVDIAMPRDIDPVISGQPGVYLYDVDDLAGVIEANRQERQRQAAIVEEMIAAGVGAFSDWLTEQEVVPLIAALRSKGQAIQHDVMDSLANKMPHMSEHDLKLLNKHTMSIVNQLLREPIQNVKELAIATGDTEYVEMFAYLFGIDESVLAGVADAEKCLTRRPSNQKAGTLVELFQRLRGNLPDDTTDEKRALHPVLR